MPGERIINGRQVRSTAYPPVGSSNTLEESVAQASASPGARAAAQVSNGTRLATNPSLTRGSNGNNRLGATRASPSQQAEDFSIVVAVRVRPFNRKEFSSWVSERQKRRQLPSMKASAALQATTRHHQRQPFGPGNETLNDQFSPTVTALAPDFSATVGGNGFEGGDDDVPEPVLDVESDGITLTLLDPQNQTGVRGAFSYDHIFSSFAPSVEIIDLMGNPRGGTSSHHSPTWGCNNGSSGVWNPDGTLMDPESPVLPAIAGELVDMDPRQEEQAEAEQVSIFRTLGLPLVDSVLEGFNACVFAYGQTSSGKTYTMMGTKKHRGLTPRICHELFNRIARLREGRGGGGGSHAVSPKSKPKGKGAKQQSMPPLAAGANIRVSVAYMEIYNEQVRDLLKQRPRNAILHYANRFDKKEVDHHEYQTLKVRHHPTSGLFVEGLTTVAVNSWEECSGYLRSGSQLRTQAATEMNASSSRSHAIFQLVITQSENTGGRVRGKTVSSQRVSKFNLVDLAGSERNSSKTNNSGKHLAETNSINFSLSTLHRVIDGLLSRKKGQVIPYRESLLTYVLSDNFGGNSKTVMCATVSPSAANLAETESTLRYATLARGVLNRVRVNEDPQARVIRELKDRMRMLQEELAAAQAGDRMVELELGLTQREADLAEMQEREAALRHTLCTREAEEQELRRTIRQREAGEAEWREEAQRQCLAKDKLREQLLKIAAEHPSIVMEAAAAALLQGDGEGGGPQVLQQTPVKPAEAAVVAGTPSHLRRAGHRGVRRRGSGRGSGAVAVSPRGVGSSDGLSLPPINGGKRTSGELARQRRCAPLSLLSSGVGPAPASAPASSSIRRLSIPPHMAPSGRDRVHQPSLSGAVEGLATARIDGQRGPRMLGASGALTPSTAEPKRGDSDGGGGSGGMRNAQSTYHHTEAFLNCVAVMDEMQSYEEEEEEREDEYSAVFEVPAMENGRRDSIDKLPPPPPPPLQVSAQGSPPHRLSVPSTKQSIAQQSLGSLSSEIPSNMSLTPYNTAADSLSIQGTAVPPAPRQQKQRRSSLGNFRTEDGGGISLRGR